MLVTGPPCSGKSTFVNTLARPGDLVLCIDTFAQEAGSESEHDHVGEFWHAARLRFDQLCTDLGLTVGARAWVIRGCPEPKVRQQLAGKIGATRTVVLKPSLDVLYERAYDRDDASGTCKAITSWFRRYQPAPIDEVVDEFTSTAGAATQPS